MQKSVSWSNNFSMIGRSSRHKDWSRGLCIKVGRGQGTGTLGRVCGDLRLGDARRSMGRGDVWNRDAGR